MPRRTKKNAAEAWEAIRGMWKHKPVNGLEYQRRIRTESDQRLHGRS